MSVSAAMARRRRLIDGDVCAMQTDRKNVRVYSESQDKMKGGFFLDVVISKGATVLELLAGEDEPLLVWRNAFLVLDFGLYVFDRVRGFDLDGDGLAGEGLDEDLHLIKMTKRGRGC